MRFIGIDIHRDFCEVAIAEGGQVRSAGRIASEESELELFAGSLGAEDRVAMEVSGNASAIARIIEPHVDAVLMVDPRAVRERIGNGPKTDRLDAKALARMLAGGALAPIWVPDEKTRVRRRLISRRAQLVRHRTREKNQVHAVLVRNLKGKPPMTDAFGVAGRKWLAGQQLPPDEAETVDACLRQVDFLDGEIKLIEQRIAEQVVGSEEIKRLMGLPGFGMVAATALMAAIGDVSRFPAPATWSATWASTPRSCSRAPNPPDTGGSKLEKELARQAEVAYRRLVADWQPAGARS